MEERRSHEEPAKAEVRAEDAAPARRTVKEWAEAKGHYPKPRQPGERFAPLHTGPHGDVVAAHLSGEYAKKIREAFAKTETKVASPAGMVALKEPTPDMLRRPANLTLTEEEYDAAVEGAYSIAVGENLADASAAIDKANARVTLQMSKDPAAYHFGTGDEDRAAKFAKMQEEAKKASEQSAGGTSPQVTGTRRTGAPPPLVETERATQRGAAGPPPLPQKDAAHGPGTGKAG